MLEFALRSKPRAVVIANRSAGYVNQDWGWHALNKFPFGPRVRSHQEASKAWSTALVGISGRLADAGIKVVIINPIPDTNDRLNSAEGASIARDILKLYSSRNIQATRKAAERARSLAVEAEREVPKQIAGVSTYDPMPVLCDADICPKLVNGVSAYLDWGPLSRAGSLLLVPTLTQILRDLNS